MWSPLDSGHGLPKLRKKTRKLAILSCIFQALNGQNVYNGCCSLHIDFSKLKRLSVRYNNDKSRDFTNPQLSSDADPGAPPPGQMGPWGPFPGPPGFNMEPGGSVFGFVPGGQCCLYSCYCVIFMLVFVVRVDIFC